MLRQLFSFLSAVIIAQHVCGQTSTVIYEDHFDTGAAQWSVVKGDGSLLTSGAGFMKVDNTSSEEIVALNTGKVYDFQDFTITSTLTIDGSSKSGLVLGDWSSGSYFKFVCGEAGCHVIKHDGKDVATVTGAQGAKGKVQMTLSKKGSTLEWEVNGKSIYSEVVADFPGSQLGSYVASGSSAELNTFDVSWEGQEIDMADGAFEERVKENLGSGINGAYNDLLPLVSPDGKKLYFNRKGDPNNQGKGGNDDAWFVTDKNGAWGSPVHINSGVNDKNHSSISSVLKKDGQFFVTKQFGEDGKKIKDGYFVTSGGAGGHGKPKKLKIKGYKNDQSFISATMSVDKKVIILCLDNELSEGSSDLYVSTLIKGNQYSEPVNLGSTINSPGTEITPFLSKDKKKLYFSSDGFPGYGGSDVFISRRIGSGWQKWTKPTNLGSSVNSKGWEAYYSTHPLKDEAYFCSNISGQGKLDIFKVSTPSTEALTPMLMLKGHVYDTTTGKPLAGQVSVRNLYNDTLVAVINADKEGYFEVELQRKLNYSILGEKDGFNADKEEISVARIQNYQVVEQDLWLKKFEEGQKINLNRIYFVQSKPEILETSLPELDKLVDILNEHTELRIRIEGHTDNMGGEKINLQLSEDRTVAIKAYLVEKGIVAKRLKTKGYGESRPIASNRNEETRKLNRRVEFVIIK